MRQFTTAAKRGAAAVNNPEDLIFEWEIREGEFVEMTAHPPTTGQMALFLAHQSDQGAAAVRSLFEFLETVLDQANWKVIEDQLRTGLDVAVTIELVQYLTSEWSARPTSPPSDSSTSPPRTGRRSTVRHQAMASTT